MDYQLDDMMHQENRTSGQAPPEPKQPPNNMATASLVMGILAAVTCCCYYTGFIFGGLGILFALLSRTDKKMCGQAKAGLALSIAGMVLVVLLWGVLVLFAYPSGGHMRQGPIQNLPVVPDFTQPGLDNILTILRRVTAGGGVG